MTVAVQSCFLLFSVTEAVRQNASCNTVSLPAASDLALEVSVRWLEDVFHFICVFATKF
jgi:hypothetical protein